MSTITVQMPEGLAAQLRETAETAGVSLDQFLSSAAAEKLSAWQTLELLRARAIRAHREAVSYTHLTLPTTPYV